MHTTNSKIYRVGAAALLLVFVLAASNQVAVAEEEPLISGFAVLVPGSPADCALDNPWRDGRWALMMGGSLPSGACLVLSYTVHRDSLVLLLYQGPDGELLRLAPSLCSLRQVQVLAAGEQLFPQPLRGREQLLKLDHQPGQEQFHLLAFEPTAAARTLFKDLASLSVLNPRCQQSSGVRLSVSQLRVLAEHSGVPMQWQTRKVDHY